MINTEQVALIENSLGACCGKIFSRKRTPRQYLLPFACTLNNRDVAIYWEISKAFDGTAGLRPTHFQPRDFGLLPCSQYKPGIMRGQKTAAADLHPASLKIARLVRDAGTDRVGI